MSGVHSVLDGILSDGESDGEMEMYGGESKEVLEQSDDESRPKGQSRRSRESHESDEDVVMKEKATESENVAEQQVDQTAKRKYARLVLPTEMVKETDLGEHVPGRISSALHEDHYWGMLPVVTIQDVLKEAKEVMGGEVRFRYEEQAAQAEKLQEQLKADEVEARKALVARAAAEGLVEDEETPAYYVVFGTVVAMEQSEKTSLWAIRNPVTEKTLNTAFPKGKVVLVFLNRTGYHGYATMLSKVGAKDLQGVEDDDLSAWCKVMWGVRSSLDVQKVADYAPAMPAEGTELDAAVGLRLCRALAESMTASGRSSGGSRGDQSREDDRGDRSERGSAGRVWGVDHHNNRRRLDMVRRQGSGRGQRQEYGGQGRSYRNNKNGNDNHGRSPANRNNSNKGNNGNNGNQNNGQNNRGGDRYGGRGDRGDRRNDRGNWNNRNDRGGRNERNDRNDRNNWNDRSDRNDRETWAGRNDRSPRGDARSDSKDEPYDPLNPSPANTSDRQVYWDALDAPPSC